MKVRQKNKCVGVEYDGAACGKCLAVKIVRDHESMAGIRPP